MSRRLRAAVLGAGGMGRTHVSAISHLPEQFELVAICDENIDAAVAARVDFNLRALAFDRFEFMLDQMPEIDLVVIAVPHDQLASATIFALEHNINTLCEKPGCLDLQEFRRIEEAATRSHATYALGFIKRYHWMFETAEARLKAGDVGEILHVVFNDEWRHHGLHDTFETAWAAGLPNWRSVAAHNGRDGEFFDTGAHSISAGLALSLHQPNEVLMVDSRDNLPQYLQMEGPDSYDVRLRTGTRGRVILNTSWAHNDGGEPMFRVHGTLGQLIGRFVKDEHGEVIEEKLTYTKFGEHGQDEIEIQTWPKESEARRQLTDFGRCIRSGEEPRNGLTHIRAFVELRERVLEFNARQIQATAQSVPIALTMSAQ